MKKTLFTVFLLFFCGAVWAQEPSPLNPAYVEWLMRGSLPARTAAGGHTVTGRIPLSFNAWTLPEDNGTKRGSLPAAYDLRDEGRVPPVRNQNPYGTCWAFGAVASMEGYYLTEHPRSSIEYSVFNVIRGCNDIWDTTVDSGGNYLKSAAYYTLLRGPVYEKDDPYVTNLPSGSVPPPPAKTPAVRGYITGAEFVPNIFNWFDSTSSVTDGRSLNKNAMDCIKQILMDKGMLEYSLYYDDSYLKNYSDRSAYYCPVHTEVNHTVTIIGWDDNFSKTSFKSAPAGNGAWLVRNSWGPDWGKDGCFWVSYYDMSAEDYCKFTMTEDTSIYNKVYNKERKGLVTGLKALWGAVGFTMAENGTAVDAGTYVLAGGRTVTCYIYVNGALKKTVPKDVLYPGWYLFPADFSYVKGDAVELRFKYDTENQGVDYVPLSNDAALASEGKSYISNDGEGWGDTFTMWGAPYAVCAKLYTKTAVAVTGVKLDASSITLEEGQTRTLKATVSPADATDKTVSWSSSDTSVATVSSSGKVKGKAAGSAIVTVKTKDGGFSARCKVTVTDADVPVTGVALDTDFLKLEKGDAAMLTATVSPSNAHNRMVTWKSDDKSIATVTSSGLVKAVGPGTTKVRVKTKDGGFEAKCKVRVVVSATGVELDKTTVKLKPGESYTMKASVLPADATNREVSWMSYDTSVATVDANGKVKAVGVGETKIRVKTRDGGFKAKCKVKVSVPVEGISLNKTSVTVNKGSSVTLKATVAPADATDKTVTWLSYDTSVATVDANGKVKGVKPGKVDIRAKTKDGDFTAKCKVTVK